MGRSTSESVWGLGRIPVGRSRNPDLTTFTIHFSRSPWCAATLPSSSNSPLLTGSTFTDFPRIVAMHYFEYVSVSVSVSVSIWFARGRNRTRNGWRRIDSARRFHTGSGGDGELCFGLSSFISLHPIRNLLLSSYPSLSRSSPWR